MLEFIAEYQYVWIFIALISIISVASLFIYGKKQKEEIKAQIVEPVSFLGCLVVLFASLGAISAILSIIASILKLVVFKITGG